MRVAVIGRSTNAGSFVAHIAADFELLGHEVSTHQARLMLEPWRGRLANVGSIVRTDLVSRSRRATRLLYRPMLRELAAASPDLIVTTMPRTDREQVESWRAAAPSARVVLWSPDAIVNFGSQQAFVAGFDRIYVKDPYLVDRLAHGGGVGEVRYLAEGAPSEVATWAASQSRGARSSAIAMIGNIYPSRSRFLEELVELTEVDLHGSMNTRHVAPAVAARFTGRYLWSTEKYAHFRTARAVLNNLHYSEVGSLNYRAFEAAGCGGVVAIDDVPQVKRYFEPGDEVIVFASPRSLVDQLDELTVADLDAVGERAQQRVAREHLIRHRLAEMLDDLRMG